MSQLLSEAMHGIERAVEKAAAQAVEAAQAAQASQRNDTQAAHAVKLHPTFGQPKMWFFPALQSVLNASRTGRANRPAEVQSKSPLPPWAPASLFLNWPGVPQLLGQRLPVFAVHNATNWSTHEPNSSNSSNSSNWSNAMNSSNSSIATFMPLRLRCGRCNGTHALTNLHLQRARRRLPPPPLLQRRLLSTLAWREDDESGTHRRSAARRSLQPNITASATEIWSSPHFMNSPHVPHLNRTWVCASGFAQSLEATTALGCADALALALSATALLTCFVTLLCVWLLVWRRRHAGTDTPAKLADELQRPPAVMTSTLVDDEPLSVTPLTSDAASPLASPLQRFMNFVPKSDRKFSALC
jgi:type II secretory pathway pseudopilin PulG